MEHPDFSWLLEHLRRSVKHFVLFEAIYLSGQSHRELARRIGISERSLRRRLRSVRRVIASSFDELDRAERYQDSDIERDYFV